MATSSVSASSSGVSSGVSAAAPVPAGATVSRAAVHQVVHGPNEQKVYLPVSDQYFLQSPLLQWLKMQGYWYKKLPDSYNPRTDDRVVLFNSLGTPASSCIVLAPPAARWFILDYITSCLPVDRKRSGPSELLQEWELQQLYWSQNAYGDLWQPEDQKVTPHPVGARLAVDVDSHGRVLTLTEIRHMAETLSQTCYDYLGRYVRVAALTYAHPTLKDNLARVSLHLVAHVRVSVPQAQQLLLGFKVRFRASGVSPEGLEVDLEIYKRNHNLVNMRLPYCFGKAKPCHKCNNYNLMKEHAHLPEYSGLREIRDPYQRVLAGRKECGTCAVMGGVLPRYPYQLVLAIGDDDGRQSAALYDRWCASADQMMRACSLWPEAEDATLETYRVPTTDPTWEAHVAMYQELKQAARTLQARGGKHERSQRLLRPMSTGSWEAFHVSPGAQRHLQSLINNFQFRGERPWTLYRFAEARVMRRRPAPGSVGQGPSPPASVALTTPGMDLKCLYAHKNHGEGRVYFVLNRHKSCLIQKCRSDKHQCTKENNLTIRVPSTLLGDVFGLELAPDLSSARPQSLDPSQGFHSLPAYGPGLDDPVVAVVDRVKRGNSLFEQQQKQQQEQKQQRAKRQKLSYLRSSYGLDNSRIYWRPRGQ